MTVVYIDSVFVLNTLMDYLLCLVTARLAGIPLRRRRYLLAALAGGGYAVAVFLPGCGGRLCDSDRLWRGGAFGKADAAAFCALLCLGGVRDGSGGTGRQRGSDGERNFLYGCGYKGFADCGWQCGFGIDSGFSCGGTSQYRRGSADGADLHGGKDYQARGTAG